MAIGQQASARAVVSGMVALLCGASAFAQPASDRPDGATASPPLASSERWVSPAELLATASGEVERTARGKAARLEVNLPREGVRGLVVEAQSTDLRARPLPSNLPLTSRMSIWIDVRRNGIVQRSVLVPVQVKAWQPGLVPWRDLPAGTRLAEALLRHEDVDVAAGGQAAWTGEPQGRVLRTPVLAGHYLGEQQVALVSAVSRGERVELRYRMGGVQVQAAASALQDGEPGQHIQVRVDAAQGPVLARVVEAGRVELIK